MSFEEGFATGLKLGEMWRARDEEEQAKQDWIKNNPEKAARLGLTKKEDTTVKSQGEIGSPLTGFKSSTPAGSSNTVTPQGYDENTVTTAPLNKEEPIEGVPASPSDYPTSPVPEDKTKIEKTSPYGTYDEKGMESPADMPHGYGAIPMDEKPPVGEPEKPWSEKSPAQAKDTAIVLPQHVQQKLQEAKSPEEAAGIINGYKQSQAGTQETPKQNLYQKTVTDIQEAHNNLNVHEQELKNIQNTADAFRARGKFKEAAAYEKEAIEQQKRVYDSTEAFYKVYNKGLDLQGSFIKSYKNEVANGVPVVQEIGRAHV